MDMLADDCMYIGASDTITSIDWWVIMLPRRWGFSAARGLDVRGLTCMKRMDLLIMDYGGLREERGAVSAWRMHGVCMEAILEA